MNKIVSLILGLISALIISMYIRKNNVQIVHF
jgi:hypothetical protein